MNQSILFNHGKVHTYFFHLKHETRIWNRLLFISNCNQEDLFLKTPNISIISGVLSTVFDILSQEIDVKLIVSTDHTIVL